MVMRCVVPTTAGQIAGFVSSFLANLLLVRFVSVPFFGEYALALAAVEVSAFLASFAVNQAVLQYAEDGMDSLAAAVALSVGLSAAILVLGLASCFAIHQMYGGQTVVFAAWLFIAKAVQLLSAPYLMLYERRLDYSGLAVLKFSSMALANWSAVAIAVLGWPAASLAVRGVAADFVVFSFVFLTLVPQLGLWTLARKAERQHLKKALNFGARSWVLRSLEQILYNVDVLLIKFWFPTTSTYIIGCYSQASYLAKLPNALTSSLQTVAYRLYLATKERRPDTVAVADMVTQVATRSLLPFCFVLVWCPVDFLRLLYGEVWIDAAPMLRIFGAYSLIVAVFAQLRSYLVVAERWRDLYRIYGTALVAYICLMSSPLHKSIESAAGLFLLTLTAVLAMTWQTVRKALPIAGLTAIHTPATVAVGSAIAMFTLRWIGVPFDRQPLLHVLTALAIPSIALAILDRELLSKALLVLLGRGNEPLAGLEPLGDRLR